MVDFEVDARDLRFVRDGIASQRAAEVATQRLVIREHLPHARPNDAGAGAGNRAQCGAFGEEVVAGSVERKKNDGRVFGNRLDHRLGFAACLFGEHAVGDIQGDRNDTFAVTKGAEG